MITTPITNIRAVELLQLITGDNDGANVPELIELLDGTSDSENEAGNAGKEYLRTRSSDECPCATVCAQSHAEPHQTADEVLSDLLLRVG